MKKIKQLIEFSIVNIDKPSGPTSFQVSEYICKRLGLKKTSHLGTLDPAVSGVLPITLGRACRLSTYLMKKDKVYIGIMRIHDNVTDEILKKEMKKFVGKIKQMPPVRSSVKRAEREREVFEFKFLERDGKDVLFETHVEAGTYIRTLIYDLGKKIGGAHMLELKRIKAGIFEEKDSVTLYDFDKAVDEYEKGNEEMLRKILIPAEDVVKKTMPAVNIKADNTSKILTGKPIHSNDLIGKVNLKKGEYIAVFCGERFIEIARVVNEGDVIAKADFVLN